MNYPQVSLSAPESERLDKGIFFQVNRKLRYSSSNFNFIQIKELHKADQNQTKNRFKLGNIQTQIGYPLRRGTVTPRKARRRAPKVNIR